MNLERAIERFGFGKIATTPGELLVTTSENDLMIWRMDDWECVQRFENVHASSDKTNTDHVRINELLVLSDGVHLATSSREDPLPRLFDLGTAGALDLQAENSADPRGIEQLLNYPDGGPNGSMLTRSASGVQLWFGSNGNRTFGTERYCSSMDVAENGLIAFADGTDLVVMTPGG